MDWQKLLIAAGGAAGLAAILYYLLRDDPEGEQMLLAAEEDKGKKKDGALSKAEVLQILQDISGMQTVMKANMKALTKEMAEKNLEFKEIYARVKEAQPTDPLEARGLNPEDLDRFLQSNSSDGEVMLAVSKIMGPPEPPADGEALTKRAKEISVELIVEIHTFMLKELQNFMRYFQELPEKGQFEAKTVGIASQAMLDSKVAAKFSVSSEDMEGAILSNKTKLIQDMKFMQTHMEMQMVMQQFLGPNL